MWACCGCFLVSLLFAAVFFFVAGTGNYRVRCFVEKITEPKTRSHGSFARKIWGGRLEEANFFCGIVCVSSYWVGWLS